MFGTIRTDFRYFKGQDQNFHVYKYTARIPMYAKIRLKRQGQNSKVWKDNTGITMFGKIRSEFR